MYAARSGMRRLGARSVRVNTRQIELRPIIQKNIRRYQFDFNPVFERGWRGQGASKGWVFEPNLRLG
jgi:hypothetical protein